MKFITIAVAMLLSATEATQLTATKHHHHRNYDYVQTLPDVRADTVADADIAAHEAARSEAAKVKKNPQAAVLSSIRSDLE